MSQLFLRVADGRDLVPVRGGLVIGRGADADVTTDDPATSGRHCRVVATARGAVVEDLGSTNGTWCAGTRRQGPFELRPGDTFVAGRTSIQLLELRRRAPAPAGHSLALVRSSGELSFLANGDEVRVGRDATSNDVVFEDRAVSSRHAVWRWREGRWTVEDLGSRNGTHLDGRRVHGAVDVAPSEVVSFGSSAVRMTVVDLGAIGTGPDAVRIAVGDGDGERAVLVGASPTNLVGDVCLAIVGFLGLDSGVEHHLRRARDGQLLHPLDRWSGTGTRRGDLLVVGQGTLPASSSAGIELRFEPPVEVRSQLPRSTHLPAEHRVELPQPPETLSLRGRGLLWQAVAGLGGVVGGIAMAILRPSFAVFGLLTAGLGLIGLVAGILGEQSRRRFKRTQFDERIRSLGAELDGVLEEQARALRAASPDDDGLSELVTSRSTRLWERRRTDEDLLRLSLGTGTRRARVAVGQQVSGSSGVPELADLLGGRSSLKAVPVLAPGPAAPVVGIAGDLGTVNRLADRWVVEAAILHPPSVVRIWVLADNPGWEWARWLPHARTGDGTTIARHADDVPSIARRLERALDESEEAGASGLAHLVVVSPMVARTPAVSRLLDRPLSERCQVAVLAGNPRDLPGGCDVVVSVGADGRGHVEGAYADAPVGGFRCAGLPRERAAALAVALAPVVERLDEVGRTAPAGLVEIIAGTSASTVDVGALWDHPTHPPTSSPIGAASDGAPLLVGFRPEPHVFVAGTTGSGKSELLQSLLVGLALLHPPTDLNLFLIDFKGRATFGPLATLPHVVGVLTDLEDDPTLAERAFTAVDAEIERRKRILDDARVPNVIEYAASRAASDERLPTLVVVIDELQKLIEHEPEVRRRLDTVASQGRSLGVHLLLATQSPTGVITTTIEANTNLWVCLRVATTTDSVAILGSGHDEAARLPNLPGAGFLRQGRDREPVRFRVARIARPLSEADSSRVVLTPFVDDAPHAGSTRPRPEGSGGDDDRKEIDVVVERIAGQAAARGLAPQRQLWLPPLPASLSYDGVLADLEPRTERLEARIGLVDLPEVPAQLPFAIDLSTAGNALVLGVLGAGKTGVLLQVGADLAAVHGPDRLHLYGLDAGGGSLSPLLELPQAASVVGSGDVERVDRLLHRLQRIVNERRQAMVELGVADLTGLRLASSTPLPWIVVLVDDFIAFRETADGTDHGRPLDQLTSVVRNGPPVGVHVVVAATQSTDMRASFANVFGARLLLRVSDPSEYFQVGLRFRPGSMPSLPPGRGFDDAGRTVQVVRAPDPLSSPRRHWRAAAEEDGPRPISSMPRELHAADLPPAATVGVPLGVGGPEVEPVHLDLAELGGVLAVAGPNRSGRTTALRTLVDGALRSGAASGFAVVATRKGPLHDLSGAEGLRDLATRLDEVAPLLERFADAPSRSLLVVDDAEQLTGQLAGLEAILRAAPDRGHLCLVASRPRDLQANFEPWSRYLLSLRTALLLQPTGDDAFLFGTKVPGTAGPHPVGRALLTSRALETMVQVALP